MARGLDAKSTADEFLVHSNEEQAHADQLAARIVQLGGEPDFAPDGLSARSDAEYVAEKDPATSHMLRSIPTREEEHAEELSDLLVRPPARP